MEHKVGAFDARRNQFCAYLAGAIYLFRGRTPIFGGAEFVGFGAGADDAA